MEPLAGTKHPDPSAAPGPDLPSPTLRAVAPALSLPPAPELAWLHTHHHLAPPYLCLSGAAPSCFSLHELVGLYELCPILYPILNPIASAVLCTLHQSAAPPRPSWGTASDCALSRLGA